MAFRDSVGQQATRASQIIRGRGKRSSTKLKTYAKTGAEAIQRAGPRPVAAFILADVKEVSRKLRVEFVGDTCLGTVTGEIFGGYVVK